METHSSLLWQLPLRQGVYKGLSTFLQRDLFSSLTNPSRKWSKFKSRHQNSTGRGSTAVRSTLTPLQVVPLLLVPRMSEPVIWVPRLPFQCGRFPHNLAFRPNFSLKRNNLFGK